MHSDADKEGEEAVDDEEISNLEFDKAFAVHLDFLIKVVQPFVEQALFSLDWVPILSL